MIRYIFCDVDGTLVGGRKPISEDNLEAIRKVREKGLDFIISSGRAPSAVRPLTGQIGLDEDEHGYIICSNGALVLNNKYEILHNSCISKSNFRMLLDYLMDTGNNRIVFTTMEHYYLVDRGAPLDPRFPVDGVLFISYEEALKIGKETDVYKFLFPIEDPKMIEPTGSEIIRRSKGELAYAMAVATDMDVNNVDASKGKAIRKILEYTGGDIEETLAIGDNLNDWEMLKGVRHATCPANAADEIKAICEYVSPYACDEGAVADIINRYIR